MNTAFKLRSGSGGIFAFLILAAVFTSIAGIAFIVINKGSAKTPEAGSASCTYNGSATARVGDSFTITHNGFAAGEKIILGSNFSGSTVQMFGTTEDSIFGSKTTSKYTFADTVSTGGYTVMIQTRFPIVNFVCGQVNIVKDSYTLSPAVVSSGKVTFTFDPASNGKIVLIVKNTTKGSVAYDSGRITSGLNSIVWQRATQPGNYSANLVNEFLAPTSNTINFSIKANRYDFNSDGALNSADQTLLASAFGSTNSTYDLSGDGQVNSVDQSILAQAIAKYPAPTKYCY